MVDRIGKVQRLSNRGLEVGIGDWGKRPWAGAARRNEVCGFQFDRQAAGSHEIWFNN
jgi:hypothetical protein